MLICGDCRKVIYDEELKPIKERHYNSSGEFLGEEEIEPQCSCKGYFEEAHLCTICGEIYLKEEEVICENCLKENKTYGTCMEIGEDIQEGFNLNGFLASVFSEREIEECLKKEFLSLPKYKQQEYIDNFVKEDIVYFVDWLDEKNKNVSLH